MSDTKKFRQAFKDAGFLQVHSFLPIVFNDKRKKSGIRRLKLWYGDRVFDTPRAVQVSLEKQLKKQFGSRYLCGEFIARDDWCGRKSFVVYLMD